MNNSVWPSDMSTSAMQPKTSPDKLHIFFLCPSNPKDKYDDLSNFIKHVCVDAGKALLVELNCERAVDIISSGIIHNEIWTKIKTADVIIADITGQNGNVMFELGLAASWHKKQNVIIIREGNTDEDYLFDIHPVRHINYKSTPQGFGALRNNLTKILIECLSSAPFDFEDITPTKIILPFEHDFSHGKDTDVLWSPSITHRRIKDNYLEFGSLYVYPYSWISVGNLMMKNINVRSEMRFTMRKEPNKPNSSWIGIMLRGQSFWANFGHLVYLRDDGMVIRTEPKDEIGTYEDKEVKKIANFNCNDTAFIPFNLSLDDKQLNIKIGAIDETFLIKDLPYVFSEGRVQIQTSGARVGIKNIKVKQL